MKDLLIADHREIDAVLSELFAAFDAGDAGAVHEKLDFFWARLAMHIRAENLHLFPSILKAARLNEQNASNGSPPPGFVRDSINELENDHNFFMRELGDCVKKLFELRENNWRNAGENLTLLREKIEAVRERLRRHNELEESYAYDWAEVFAPADVAVLRSKIQKELENLPPRFAKI